MSATTVGHSHGRVPGPAAAVAAVIGAAAAFERRLAGEAFVSRAPATSHSKLTKVGNKQGHVQTAIAEPKVPPPMKRQRAQQDELTDGHVALVAVAAGLGGAMVKRHHSRDTKGASAVRQALPQIDWVGSRTGWKTIKGKALWEVNLMNEHGVLTLSAVTLFVYQMFRILTHQSPSQPEVWITTAIYLPWIFLTMRDTGKLEKHYQVTFYASCGWSFMYLTSLISVAYQETFPEQALNILACGNAVFAFSCAYFYGYHWTRMWRHYQQSRFRPLWIPGLVGLMALHALTPFDFAKRVDDGGWWKTVCTIYPDEWWWVADVRCIELFVTAAALWLIILHIQGVFTGMKNAVVVVVGTIFVPLLIMVAETSWLHASAWQHYFMVGPKYW